MSDLKNAYLTGEAAKAIEEKDLYSNFFFLTAKVSTSVKVEGWGVGLNGTAIKKKDFAASVRIA